jgi:outer membrane receptor for ferrienterochelin and colicins
MRFGYPTPFWVGVLLTFIVHAAASAQTGTITGVVRSAETGAPLISAVVQVTGPDGGRVGSSLTNQSGRYRIAAVPAGSYTVLVAMTGYETGRQTNVTVAVGDAAVANFDLAFRAIDLDPITVSASRREERALDAPARVEVVAQQAIEDRPAIQPMEHLQGVPGVDIVSQGIQSTNVVARGFNNVFSGALLALTDHRIAAIPSLRVNALHLIPAINEDIERVEVVLGPGSALYGPNTANGVLHMFTRSPLTYQGTTLTATGGERSVFHGTGRTAHLVGENLGLKLSGEYLRGDEWEYHDPEEILPRDFDVAKWAIDARADWRFRPDATLILSAGRTTSARNLEMTGIGTAQVRDWAYGYYQARFNWNRLFAQAYLNTSDAGETFQLRTGQETVDNSRFWVAQIQHGATPVPWQNFTYGADFLRTLPDTEGTIHGRFEDEDDYTEAGIFLQSETTINRRVDLVLAGRLDTHSVVDATVFSPRAALVFKPAETQTIRASYNRAYSNPGSVQLFLDINAGGAGPLGPLGYNVRAMGTGRDGFAFRADDGQFYMRSPFGASPGQQGTAEERMQLRPITVQTLWEQQVRGLATALRADGTLDDNTAAAFVGFLLPQAPQSMGIHGLNTVTGFRGPFQPPEDVPGIRESNVTTYEIGYKGIVGGQFLLAADVWYAQRDNFVSPLLAQNPLVLLQPEELVPYAVPRMTQLLLLAGFSDEEAAATAAQMAAGMAQIPGGVVTPPNLELGPDLLVSYRNFGDINLWGTDLSAQALFGRWNATVSTSIVSDDYFVSEGQIIALNAPARKASLALGYRDEGLGFNGEARVRYNAEFPAQSGTFVGLACVDEPINLNDDPCVEAYTIVDLTLGYRLPQVPGASLQLSVQNLLDSGYRSFVGAPEIGRMALLRLRYDF